ncbi:MAG: helix-turn-helix domain-containing protein [Patescibacteria group bacterium]
MEDRNIKINRFFLNLDLNQDEASVYLSLLEQEVLSVLELARKTNIPRTNIYRILERLKNLGLVEEIIDQKRTLAKASNFSHLEWLIAERKQKAKNLELALPEIKNILKKQRSVKQGETKVVFYRGKNGIKQLLWNSLKTKEVAGYAFLSYEDSTDKKFAQQFREERWRRKIKIRDLISDNDKYLSRKNLLLIKQSPVFQYYQARYLPASRININHDLIIYSDTIAFYQWLDEEIFGVEIRNQSITKLQKQIFEMLWPMAKTPEQALKNRENEK